MIALIGVFRREFGRLLAGSGVTLCLPLGLAWIAWQRFYGVQDMGAVDSLDAAFRAMALVLVPLAVWLSAPSFSVERTEHTAALWAISPVRPSAVLLGKYFAILTVSALALLLLIAPLLIQLVLSGNLPWFRLAAGLGGLFLLVAATSSLTLLASSLVAHFSTAFIWGLGLMAAWLWGPAVADRTVRAVAHLAPDRWMSLVGKGVEMLSFWDARAVVMPMFVGWVDLGSVVAMLAVVLLFLITTRQVVASERWRD